jgi:hypothetical protein
MKSVYAIAGTDGRIKVGVSNNPTQRAERFKSRVVYSTSMIENAFDVEKTAHSLLDEHRSNGEWFTTTQENAVKAIEAAVGLVESGDFSRAIRKLNTGLSEIGLTIIKHLRLNDEESDALADAARREVLPEATLLRKIVVEWLRANGWLKPVKKERS